MQADLQPVPLQQQLLQHLQQAWHGLQARLDDVMNSERFQELLQIAMQQWMAAASCLASLLLLLATIAAGKL
jgi:succinate dehydrogenase hydrophobic anchor subunit